MFQHLRYGTVGFTSTKALDLLATSRTYGPRTMNLPVEAYQTPPKNYNLPEN
jgi:hypothetical protein